MDIYRIPRREIPVRVLLDDGRTLDGTFFTHESGPGGCPQDVLHHINESDGEFVPLLCGRDSFLVNKAGIIWVELTGAPAEEIAGSAVGAQHVLARLRIAGGASVAGTLAVVMPPERSRVLDYLNAAGRFVAVFREGTVTLVQRRFIVTVRSGEGATRDP
jgi:hypothetical protein